MPVSKAQQKAVNKYMSENYDRINLTVPKGQKEIIKAHAEAHSESVNGFINRAIETRSQRRLWSGTTALLRGQIRRNDLWPRSRSERARREQATLFGPHVAMTHRADR